MTFKQIMERLYVKLVSFKAMLTVAIIVVLVTHNFTPENADVLRDLIYAVLGAKAVQYAAAAMTKTPVSPEE